eukprot:6189296-Pleurochrysis_carterae.AAC.4
MRCEASLDSRGRYYPIHCTSVDSLNLSRTDASHRTGTDPEANQPTEPVDGRDLAAELREKGNLLRRARQALERVQAEAEAVKAEAEVCRSYARLHESADPASLNRVADVADDKQQHRCASHSLNLNTNPDPSFNSNSTLHPSFNPSAHSH